MMILNAVHLLDKLHDLESQIRQYEKIMDELKIPQNERENLLKQILAHYTRKMA